MFGAYNADLERLRQLVMSENSSQLSIISSLAESLADRTSDSELKDDLNTIALESHYFEDYSHSNPWKRWQGFMRNVETSARTSGASSTDSGGSNITDARPAEAPSQVPENKDTLNKWFILAGVITLLAIGYYFYSTGVIG